MKSVLLLLAIGPLTAVPAAWAIVPPNRLADADINAAVKSELKLEKGVFPDTVTVTTQSGITTLSGAVDNLLAQERAVQIAETVRGVVGVIDAVVVTPVVRTDEAIRHDVLTALQQDPASDTFQVAAAVQGATVTLSGQVGSSGEQRLCGRIAKEIKGVKAVVNQIAIKYDATRSDTEIASDINARLQWDVWIDGARITATVKQGAVTLSGTVGSLISKLRASDDAWTSGVAAVDTAKLTVDPRSERPDHAAIDEEVPPDTEIKQAIVASLHQDPRVAAFALEINVESGVVVLGGNVGSLKAKSSAEQDARDIVGVWEVDNLLKVTAAKQVADPQIENQLKAALAWDAGSDSSGVDVAVIKGTAYLSGTVESAAAKAEAQEVASKITGVLAVRNHLQVEPPVEVAYGDGWPYDGYYGWGYGSIDGWPSYAVAQVGPQPYLGDAAIEKKIETRFFWSPFVDRNDVQLNVHGAVATLTGTVGTWIGWGEAQKDALKGGATAVINQLRVTPHHW